MVGTVFLARLLSPDDYGLVAMVAVVLGFAKMFRGAGLMTATVQQPSITPEQVSTLFWLNAAVAGTVGLCILASAPLLVAFYDRPELLAITAVLAGAFVVNGLSLQHDALLQRHMRFGALALEQVVAQAIAVVVMVAAAFAGFGYWALVIGACTTALITTLMSFYLCAWIPGRFRRGTGVREMLRFGGNVVGFNFVNYFSRNADNILIGRFLGAEELGLYSKAYNLFLVPLIQVRDPLVAVAMPALSALREQPERFARYYARLVDGASMLGVPLAVYCLVEADFLIGLILGPQWVEVVPVFRILATVGIVSVADGTRGVVLLSQGLAKRHFRWGLINAVVVVSAFIIGLQYGIVGVATAYAVACYALLLPSLFYAFAGTPVTVGLFMKALVPSVLYAAVAALVTLAVRSQLATESLQSGLVSSLAFVVVYVALTATRRSARQNLRLFMPSLGQRAAREPARDDSDSAGPE